MGAKSRERMPRSFSRRSRVPTGHQITDWARVIAGGMRICKLVFSGEILAGALLVASPP